MVTATEQQNLVQTSKKGRHTGIFQKILNELWNILPMKIKINEN